MDLRVIHSSLPTNWSATTFSYWLWKSPLNRRDRVNWEVVFSSRFSISEKARTGLTRSARVTTAINPKSSSVVG